MKLLRRDEVCERVALSYTSVWKMIRAGRFPAAIVLNRNVTRWSSDEVDRWLEEQAANGQRQKLLGMAPDGQTDGHRKGGRKRKSAEAA